MRAKRAIGPVAIILSVSCGTGAPPAKPAHPGARPSASAAALPSSSSPPPVTTDAGSPAADAGAPPSAPKTPDPPIATADEAISGYVLVWWDAKLYAGPSMLEPSVMLATLEARGDSVGSAVPLRVLSATAEFVEVEVLVGESECGWSAIELAWPADLAKVTLFVRRADLAPVVGKRFEKTFADGSSLRLEQGAPVVPDKDGWLVGLPGDRIVTPLPSDVVRHAYSVRAPKEPRAKRPSAGWTLTSKGTIALGDATYTRVANVGEPVSERVEQRKDRILFPVATRCSRVVLSVPTDEASKFSGEQYVDPMFGKGTGGFGIDRHFFPPGTVLTWGGGRRTATTTKEIDVTRPKPGDTTACVERELRVDAFSERYDVVAKTPEPERTMHLCGPVAGLKHDGGGIMKTIPSRPLP